MLKPVSLAVALVALVIIPVAMQYDLVQLTNIAKNFNRYDTLVAVVLTRLIAPRIVAEACYCNDKADNRNEVAPNLIVDSITGSHN